ncbi:MAG: class I SAM-dependent methyltransferase [Pseudomonadota bacterium]
MSSLDRHAGHLLRLTDVEGLSVLDVGCGNGAFVRTLASLGAQVVGVEIDARKIAMAEARPRVASEQYAVGRGEDLPAAKGSADLIVYLFSLHHVPIISQAMAIEEATRALRPGGRLHVVDPLPHGPATEVLLPIDDERETRTNAQNLMDSLDGQGWSLIAKSCYEIDRSYADFDGLVEAMISTDRARASGLESCREEVAEQFDRLAEWRGDRFWLSQPCVLFHLEREA